MSVIVDGTNGLTFPNSSTQTVAGAPLATPSFTTTIGVGAATASASGAGISFPATQSASSDANTLDDYEEGTWTPRFASGGTQPTVAYSGQYGYYTKIGNIVYLTCRINVSSTSGGSGGLYIKGMPFSVSAASNNFGTMTLGYQANFTTAGPTYGRYTNGNDFIELYYLSSANSEATVNVSNLSSSVQLIINMWFQSA